MAAKWGLFLCDCRKTLPLDPQRLVFPTAPSVLAFASDPDRDIHDFATAVNQSRPDRVLISCCASPSLFNEALLNAGTQFSKVHFTNLKESCFSVHPDPEQAHAKATRLLRAAMEAAEAKGAPAYDPLNVGARILIAADDARGKQLAEDLGDIAQPFLVVPLAVVFLGILWGFSDRVQRDPVFRTVLALALLGTSLAVALSLAIHSTLAHIRID